MARSSDVSIVQATRSYESWVAQHTDVVRPDVREKHRLIAESPFVFLRGTFYRWVQQWPIVCASLVECPRVHAVGDLHVENFGTWRDAEGRLVWGVNDLDEAAPLPYASDLVRLATSAVLASEEKHLTLSLRKICASILDGYGDALERGGRPVVLAERHAWLREIALQELKDPQKFWADLSAEGKTASAPPAVMRLMALPAGSADVRLFRRQAGVGSLGRPRIVALASLQGGLVAREAKAIVPPAVAWASGTPRSRSYSAEVIRRAVRAHDPFFAADDNWTVRRLSPDCSKIEIDELPRGHDDEKLLRAMGWETANIHLGTPRLRVREDLAKRKARWLQRATADMVDSVVADHKAWKKHQRAASRARA
jgi:hypothetical protein